MCQVGRGWKRPEVPHDDEPQKGPKKPCVRPASGRAASGTMEDELAGKDSASICNTSSCIRQSCFSQAVYPCHCAQRCDTAPQQIAWSCALHKLPVLLCAFHSMD